MTIDEWIREGMPLNKILYGDCMELMSHLEDKSINLAIVDPPYGIKVGGSKTFGKVGGSNIVEPKLYKTFDDLSIPNKQYFDELFRISKNQIIWGGNYFINYLYNTSCMIVWDKDNTGNFADCELAWTSFKSAVRKYRWRWNGLLQENMKDKQIRIHPTEKPIQLYRWLLQNYTKQGDKIIDTHSGSGSLAIAAHLEGFDFLAIEKDYDYWKASVERYETEISQGKLF